MYQSVVTSKPLSTFFTRSSSEPLPLSTFIIKLSPSGVYGSEVSFALARVCRRDWRTPSLIQSTRPCFCPLSKTEVNGLLAAAETKGDPLKVESDGSLKSWSPTFDNFSPTRVPPPFFENTLCPSCASRAPATHIM